MPLPMEATYENMGMPHPFMPAASLDSYDDNSFLAGAVDKIAQELSTTQFYLQIVDDDDEIEIIRKHQALDTLKKPQPTKTGKGVLTGMDLKLVTGYHLCLMGEAFWLLDKRLKIGGAPTFIDMLLPEFMNPIIKNGEIVEYIYRLPENDETKRANGTSLFGASALTPDELAQGTGKNTAGDLFGDFALASLKALSFKHTSQAIWDDQGPNSVPGH